MTALAFLASVAAIFVVVLAIEAEGDGGLKLQRPAGLITWLTRGNWPAKIGGALIIVGVAALLRYALVNIDLPPQVKLSAGVGIALLLGFASTFVPEGAARRPVSLALGGAAFGVLYLTAYSAFALFPYVTNPTGVALLGVTAAGAGVYAVTRGALSLAVLSMVGAFLAPAFSVDDPGPVVVYGYYAGASLLTLAMVALRGWRPLIHLSFAFTLAGGVFFAWTAKYYEAAHADVMLPMLLLLAAIHVAMPIFEKAASPRLWVERLDLIYMLALPTCAALLAVVIAPTRMELSTELTWLGAVWALAAAVLAILARDGRVAHAAIAAVLFILGLAARFKNLPWELITLAFAVGALGIASWRLPTGRLHGILAGMVALFGAIHILGSMASSSGIGGAFASGVFIERIIAAALLTVAGAICRRSRQALDTLLLAVGILWGVFAIGFELVRWELATLSLVAHWFFILVAASLWIPGRRIRVADERSVLLVVLVVVTGAWAAATAPAIAAWISLAGASLALIGVAVRPVDGDGDSHSGRVAAVLAVPVVAGVWAFKAGALANVSHVGFFGLTLAVLAAIGVLGAGRTVSGERTRWLPEVTDIFGVVFAALLLGATLLYIARDPAAVVMELLCVAGLAFVITIRRSENRPVEFWMAACIVGIALVLQANLMRLLGPPHDMNVSDVMRLKWPAVVSLLWAVFGSALTIWSRKVMSRTLWMSGATLLVGAAVKLLLVDFGSLGQLANILAVIAAGGVFLLVGWVAPMPPSRADRPEHETETVPRTAVGGGFRQRADLRDDEIDARNRRNAWTIAGVVVAAAVLFEFGKPLFAVYQGMQHHVERDDRREQAAANVPAPSAPQAAEPAPESPSDIAQAAVDAATTAEVESVAAAVESDSHATSSSSPVAFAASADARGRAESGAAAGMAANERAAANAESNTRATSGASSASNQSTLTIREEARSTLQSRASVVPRAQPERAAPIEARDWKPPPTVDDKGTPTYTQYSYPTAPRDSQTANAGSSSRSASTSASSVRQAPIPATGARGIDQLMREGRIRRATPRDLETWRAVTGSRRGPNLKAAGYGDNEPVNGMYVVLREMTYPEGLTGVASVTFIIPRNVPRPFGSPGHSTVFETP